MPPAERRVKKRIPARFKVDYVHEGNYLISYSRNISVDGMFICTPTPPPVGTFLQLIFSIGDLHELTVSAKVAWVNVAGPTTGLGMGVQFLNPPPLLKQTVLQMVNRVAVLGAGTDEQERP